MDQRRPAGASTSSAPGRSVGSRSRHLARPPLDAAELRASGCAGVDDDGTSGHGPCRVGVDGRSLVGGGARGVAHYTAALLEALARGVPGGRVPRAAAAGARDACRPGVAPIRHPLPARVLFGAAAVAGRPRLDRARRRLSTCVWAPAPAPLAVGDTPFVLTVHDRSWEVRPGDFTRYERLWHAAARPRCAGAARGAGAVRRRGGARRAARRVGAGAGARAWRCRSRRGRRPGPGRRCRRAVLPLRRRARAAQGARTCSSTRSSAPARAGSRPISSSPARAGWTREAPASARLGRVDDLGALYAGALAVVLPSWLEGFGLPPVEGLAAGAPAIVSDLPVLPRGARRRRAVRAARRRRGRSPTRCSALAGDPDASRAARSRRAGAQIAPLSWARDRAPDARGARGGGGVSFSLVVVLHDSAGPSCRALLALARRAPPARPQVDRRRHRLVRRRAARSPRAAGRGGGRARRATRASARRATPASSGRGIARHRPAQPGLRAARRRRSRRLAARGRRTGALCGAAAARPRRARCSAPRTRCPGRSARCCAALVPPAAAPAAAARARRAVPRRAAAQRRLGDRARASPRATDVAAAARPVRPAPVPVLRGHGPLPARPRGRDPDRAATRRVRVRHARRPRDAAAPTRRAARAARPAAARGRRPRTAAARRAALDDARPGAHVRDPRRRAPGAGPRRPIGNAPSSRRCVRTRAE